MPLLRVPICEDRSYIWMEIAVTAFFPPLGQRPDDARHPNGMIRRMLYCSRDLRG